MWTVGAIAWVLFALVCRRILQNPRGDVLGGIGWHFSRQYARLYHWLRVSGRENIPKRVPVDGRPVVVIGNHTSGVDPVLIQSVLPFFVRWVMAADMQGRGLEEFWKYLEVILVKRGGATEISGMRESLRHLRGGGALGVFPEGRLPAVRGKMHRFHTGIGLIVDKSGALVLPCVLAGTPHRHSSWMALWFPSRSRLRVMPLIDFKAEGIPADQIGADLQKRYERWVREMD